jgi:cellulose synthase/poly-beta-1,6-N-acetylglucosamine synthase-like glycosyltransferase
VSLLFAFFLVFVGIQAIYLVAFLRALNKRSSRKDPGPVPVSVIVCAHDEEENLRQLIPQLLLQEHPQFEVIIVNDRSNDGTFDYLREEMPKHSKLRVVTVDRTPPHVNGKKYAITLGVKAAAFEWVLLTDADCRPNTNRWISSMSQHFQQPSEFVVGMSSYIKQPGFLNLFIRFETLITSLQYISFALLRNPYMGVGRNLAYKKSLFLEKKGFNNFLNITGGDDDLFVNQHSNSTNTAVEFNPEAHVHSYPKTTWKSFFDQKVRHLSVGKHYRFKHRFLLGVFTATWVFTWFAGLALMAIDISNYWVPIALIFRSFLLIMTVRTMIRKSGLTFELWRIPLLDFLYSFYYISTGLIASLTKDIRWRN